MDTIQIDEVRYQRQATVTVSYVDGDSNKKMVLERYRNADSRRTFYLHHDEKVWRFYGSADEELNGYVTESVISNVSCADEHFRGKSLVWGYQHKPFKYADGPFSDTADFFSIGANGADLYYNVSVFPLTEGISRFFSASFPARRLPRGFVTGQPAISRPVEVLNLTLWVVSAALLIAGALMHTPAAIRIYWWAGPLAWLLNSMFKQNPFYLWFHALSGAFLWHFALRVIDHASGSLNLAPDDFESLRAGAELLVFAGLYAAKRKWYFTLSDAGRVGGGCSWWLFLCGLFVFSLMEEDWLLTWFSEYAAALPYSLLWPIGLLIGLRSAHSDYARVAMTWRGFQRQVNRLAYALREDFESVTSRAEQLADWADDLEDSVEISSDPQVQSRRPLAPDFAAIKQAFTHLKKCASDLTPSQRERLADDFQVLSEDLEGVVASANATCNSLRISPYLRTRE